jgi:hypothetical protein
VTNRAWGCKSYSDDFMNTLMYLEDGIMMFTRNVGQYLSDYGASCTEQPSVTDKYNFLNWQSTQELTQTSITNILPRKLAN